jgi:hypothetical protein
MLQQQAGLFQESVNIYAHNMRTLALVQSQFVPMVSLDSPRQPFFREQQNPFINAMFCTQIKCSVRLARGATRRHQFYYKLVLR